jgi:molybdopterin-containing oxidoreductase family iron-sulfur binding subunit
MTTPIDLATARERLDAARGKHYWRSLEELAGEPGFVEMLHREFPRQASEWTDAVSRRHFLSLMGASLALAGLSGCTQRPAEKIVPYVRQPEELVLGKPLFYATAMTLAGYATGLLIESHEGRPTKAEGNPQHPISRGASDIASQASLLTMYDPDRSQTVTLRGQIRNWDGVINAVRERLGQNGGQGKGVHILTEAVSSPTLAAQLERFVGKDHFPEAHWYQYEPAGQDNALAGAWQAFGRLVHTYYRLSKADVVLALDADFLSCGPGHLLYTREFAARRRRAGGDAKMNRLYSVECTPTTTGASADNRLPLRASRVDAFARALAGHLGVPGVTGQSLEGEAGRWAKVVADDLKAQAKGRTLVIAGDGQPPSVHLLAHAINSHLGNFGETVILTEPVLAQPVMARPVQARPASSMESLSELANALVNGEVETLLIVGGNPAYSAPADLHFAQRLLEKARDPGTLFVHLGMYFDETSACCHWHVPEAHYLESWSDARAVDGTASVVQPLIAPLYDGRSAHELLAALVGEQDLSAYDLVRDTWRKHWRQTGSSGNFDKYWRRLLHDGIVPDTAWPPLSITLKADWAKDLPAAPAASKGRELIIAPDPVLFDGRFANNGWLQELPKPLTKITWDNAVLMSPRTARELGVGTRTLQRGGGEHGGAHADVVKLQVGSTELEAPVWIAPGHADDAVTLHLGYGRNRAGRVGGGPDQTVGVNANILRTTTAASIVPEVTITRTGKQTLVACVQGHHNIEEEKDILRARRIIRSATLEEYEQDPNFAHRREGHRENPNEHESTEERKPGRRRELTLYPPHEYRGHKWGMAIDMTTCVGCSACVVACQAENNIPVVGKQEVMNGREMHWLRIDRYWEAAEGAKDPTYNPNVYFQPLPCMHCENAPCELVCPVAATVHSDEGTNDMVYNRCVGTRYCSNNCPYKVRRFNFLFYAESIYETPSLKLLQNPDVTVRSRGVMEKCTYCIQRINHARAEAEKEAVREKESLRKKNAGIAPDGADLPIESPGRSRLDPERPGVAVIFDGEIVTACQSACPAEAIVFGDLNDPTSRVAKLNESPLNYGLLDEDINTRPRTTYLAAVRNPNPDLTGEKA